MGFLARAALWGLVVLYAPTAAGAEANDITVTDSRKETEIRIAKLIKDRLNIDPSLKIRGGDAEDLFLQIQLGANESRGVPKVVYVIDTQIMRRDKDGKATMQVVGIDSFGDLAPEAAENESILKWANKWNSRTLPLRVYIAANRIVVGQNLLITKLSPLSENQLLSTFSTIAQFWPHLIKDLRDEGIIN